MTHMHSLHVHVLCTCTDSTMYITHCTVDCQLIAKMLTQGCICISIGSALVDIHSEFPRAIFWQSTNSGYHTLCNIYSMVRREVHS